MDRKDDPSTSSPTDEDVGSIRWFEKSSTPRSKSQISFCEKVSLNPNADLDSSTEYGRFTMDVNAFEKQLKEKREQKLHEQSPRINIHLKSTPNRHSEDISTTPSGNQIKVNIRHSIEKDDSHGTNSGATKKNISTSLDEIDHHHNPHKTKRVITYEKVFKQKSIREISITNRKSSNPENVEALSSPTIQQQQQQPQQNINYTISGRKSSSNEQVTNVDDSAYHSHRLRIASSGTPTTISISSSSNNSLLHGFTSDENVYAQPSRERIFERAGSEPPQFTNRLSGTNNNNDNNSLVNVSMNVVYAGDESPNQHEWNLVSSVVDSNDDIQRHLARELLKSSPDSDSGSGWYNEYQSQSFHTEHHQSPTKMDYKRSNSQYDNHIKQIRGIHFNLHFYSVDTSLVLLN